MANQIGKFFDHGSEEQAVLNTADHLTKFLGPADAQGHRRICRGRRRGAAAHCPEGGPDSLRSLSWFFSAVRVAAPGLGHIVSLSLAVSLTAAVLASLLGMPFRAGLAVYRVPGRRILIRGAARVARMATGRPRSLSATVALGTARGQSTLQRRHASLPRAEPLIPYDVVIST
jgi:hypothetical protein